jgi:glycosyltransferase involved in cell wall biosynthesis
LKNNKTTITVVTVCKDAEKYIAETIESVVNQIKPDSKFNIQYIIYDGNSKDNTAKIIENYAQKYPEIEYYVEDDDGLYDGLIKGFEKAKGEVVAYINAGDFYSKNAFDIVSSVFNKYVDVKWITGSKVIYNERSEIIKYALPYKYRQSLIQVGAYGKNLPFIQQESTFWKKELLNLVDYKYLKTLKKSGDMYLWFCFSKKYKLISIETYLSGFKFHENQLTFRETGNTDPYLREASTFLKKKNVFNYLIIFLDSGFWFLSKYLTQLFSFFNNQIITFDRESQEWILSESSYGYTHSAWCCDIYNNQGEGKLGLNFLLDLSKSRKITIKVKSLYNSIIIINGLIVKADKSLTSLKRNLNFFEKYVNPFCGIFYLWFKLLLGKKTIYVNFLPLWNFSLFALLPSKTILGPITGTTKTDSNNIFDSFFRKNIMPFCFKLSISIMNINKKKYLFATKNLINYVDKSLKASKFYNYSFSQIEDKNNIIKTNYEKKIIDFCFYYRKYPTKNNSFFLKIISHLAENGFKVVVIGDQLDIQNVENKGVLSEKKLNEYLSISKCSFASDENLFSLFTIDCLKNNVHIFYNKNTSIIEDTDLIQLKNQFIAIDYLNIKEAKKLTIEKFNSLKDLPIYELIDFKSFYQEYFEA